MTLLVSSFIPFGLLVRLKLRPYGEERSHKTWKENLDFSSSSSSSSHWRNRLETPCSSSISFGGGQRKGERVWHMSITARAPYSDNKDGVLNETEINVAGIISRSSTWASFPPAVSIHTNAGRPPFGWLPFLDDNESQQQKQQQQCVLSLSFFLRPFSVMRHIHSTRKIYNTYVCVWKKKRKEDLHRNVFLLWFKMRSCRTRQTASFRPKEKLVQTGAHSVAYPSVRRV